MTLLNFKLAASDASPRRREDKSREKVFLEHYSWLLQRALAMTHGQRELAEDLVHDAFVQFFTGDTELKAITDVRWYLNGLLRNLHLLHLRRATRHPLNQLSLFDHDSALIGLRTRNSSELLQSVDLLARACAFACYRKETSLTASIFILRFFHGYYPSEICVLLHAKRKVVDKWIERGRMEAKEYIESPYPLPGSGNSEFSISAIGSANMLLRQLRERIFASRSSGCSVLADNPSELGARELGHLVSCRTCLEERSRKMGLAHVSQRMADDISDRDDGKPQGGGTGDGFSVHSGRKPSRNTVLRKVYARRQEILEHKPKEISLAFDGQLRATLLVDAPSNTLNLTLDDKDVPDSVAVLSEQDFPFFLLGRNDLLAQEKHVYRLLLSDDRSLEITITPETLGPSIQVIYMDPLFAAATGEDIPNTVTAERPILSFPPGGAESAANLERGWRPMFVDRLRSLLPTMNPLLTGAIVLSIAAMLCFILWLRSGPGISAHDLLLRAQRQESGVVQKAPSGVIVQRVRIKTPVRTTERTLYRDIQRKRRQKQQNLDANDAKLREELAVAGIDWNDPLSTAGYREWRGSEFIASDSVKQTGDNLLTVTTNTREGKVLSESLTVRVSDFHAVGRTIELQDYGTIQIAELNYDVLPWSRVSQDWFEPLAGDLPAHIPTHPSSSLHMPIPPSEDELDEAQLSTLLVLNRMHADEGEQIHIMRKAEGIEVRGIVETAERKRALESQLIRVPYVTPFVFTFDEMARNQEQSGDGITGIESASDVRQPSPLEQFLVAHGETRDKSAQLARDIVQSSLVVRRDSKETSELLEQFSLRESGLTPRARLALLDLLGSHKRNIDTALGREEQLLRSSGIA